VGNENPMLPEQRDFLAWWQANVTPGERLGVKHPVAKTGQGVIPVPEATAQTGVTKRTGGTRIFHSGVENIFDTCPHRKRKQLSPKRDN
jgi:hypothetical protein